MAEELKGKTIAFLVANEGVEQVELTRPWEAVRERRRRDRADRARGRRGAGVQPPRQGRTRSTVDRAVDDARRRATTTRWCCPAASPTRTSCAPCRRRSSSRARSSRPASRSAAICHAPWTLVEAGVVEGRTLTSWPSLQTDIRNAGGDVGRRGGPRRRGAGDEPQARRPGRLLRQGRRGDRRGRARRAARGDGRRLLTRVETRAPLFLSLPLAASVSGPAPLVSLGSGHAIRSATRRRSAVRSARACSRSALWGIRRIDEG